MATCSRCLAENPDSTRFCGQCGARIVSGSPASLIPTQAATGVQPALTPRSTSSGSDSTEEGRFLPGTLLGDRYRIVLELVKEPR